MALADALKDGVVAWSKRDYKTALEKLKPLANKGNAKAQYVVGLMYLSGNRVIQDDKEAVRWFTLAAEQGSANAQNNLGLMYSNGQGVEQDYKQAVRWYTRAAEQGVADAQNDLGYMYGNGLGLPQDNVRAHMWYNIAVSNGEKKFALKNRDIVAEKMTELEIKKAQKMAQDCVAKNYKKCN